MASNRDLWPEQFEDDAFPAFPCPSCRPGRLELDKATLKTIRLGSADREHRAKGYWAENDAGRFTCTLVCSNRRCREVVAVMGDASSDEFGAHQLSSLRPHCLYPGPPLIDIPDAVPKPAAEAMKQAFTAFWGDRGSAANRLRISVERIMDAEGIKAAGLKLHERIDLFGKAQPDLMDTLDALRHVGNLGSHDGNVSREAILDTFEVYQEWLRNYYGKYPARIKGLVDKLNATKGSY
ncbi:hypothetical protein CK222_22345 [Mesorhizobium sp. WSM3866]|nr:hypothetical protein CK222_22345 [Mesorhizobium sp. WSM3866]